MPKRKRRGPHRMSRRGTRVGTKTFVTGSTRPEELARADALRPSPLLMPQRRLAQSIMDRLDTADMTLAELAIAVLQTLDRPASPKEVHALILVGRPDAQYDAVNRGLQRAIHRPGTGIVRKDAMYSYVGGDASTVEQGEKMAKEEAAAPKRAAIKNRLMEYMGKHMGETVYVSDVSKDLGVTEEQVRGAFGSIRFAHGDSFPIETVIPARAWVHRPQGKDPAKPTDTLFKLIGGPTKDGSFILEREDGTLYMAKEI